MQGPPAVMVCRGSAVRPNLREARKGAVSEKRVFAGGGEVMAVVRMSAVLEGLPGRLVSRADDTIANQDKAARLHGDAHSARQTSINA